MPNTADRMPDYARRHLRFGWWSLFAFLTLGFTLELFHGFKVGLYLDASNETRRLMWTLAHAHGALLALVHVVYGLSVTVAPTVGARHRRLVSTSLIGATVFLPGGFFLGGVSFYGGDPGVGIFIAPVGATLLMVAVFLTARAWSRPGSPRS